MSDVRQLSVIERKLTGTGATRALRKEGYVPISMYGKAQSPINLSIEERFLVKEMKDKGFYSHLFEVILDSKPQTVIVRDVQKHPVSDRPLHLDLLKIDSNSVIKVDVAIRILNEEKSPGIKQGGIMNLLRYDLPLLCKPSSIPEFIDIDLDGLKMGASIHLEDIKLPSDVKVEHPEKIETLLTIAQPKVSDSKGGDAGNDDSASETSEDAEA